MAGEILMQVREELLQEGQELVHQTDHSADSSEGDKDTQ